MKTVAIFSKPNSPQAWGVSNEIALRAKSMGFEVLLHQQTHGGWSSDGWSEEFCGQVRNKADIALSVGGDGTILGVARALFGWGRPLLGVNLGHLGFLTDVAATAVQDMLDALQSKAYDIESRILLQAHVENVGAKVHEGLAFNDVVLSKGNTGRLLDFDVYVNGTSLFSLRADGLVVSTPTGSTAYSLSAGGPILHPSLEAVAIVPLCPHSLTARPITIPSANEVTVVVRGEASCALYCDGQQLGPELGPGVHIRIGPAKTGVQMLHLRDYDFFGTLQQKLHWARPRER